MKIITPDIDGEFITARQTCQRYGGMTDMTLWRWINDPAMGFPRPYYFGRIRFWKMAELLDWEKIQPRDKRREPEAA